MKKKTIQTILVLSLFFMITLFSGCTPSTKKEDPVAPEVKEKIILEKTKQETYTLLSGQEAVDKLRAQDSFVLVIGLSDCPACISYRENMNEFVKTTGLQLYYVNNSSLLYDSFGSIDAFPRTYQIRLGNIIDMYEGRLTVEKLTEWLTIRTFMTDVVSIPLDELREKIKEKEDFLLYIGREDCRDCQFFGKQVLANYPFTRTLYFFSIRTMRNQAEESEEIQQQYESIKEEFQISWVPVIKTIHKGNIEGSNEFLEASYYNDELTITTSSIEALNQTYTTLEEKQDTYVNVYTQIIKTLFQKEGL